MLGGIVIGMNAVGLSQSIGKGDYIWASVHLAFMLLVYVIETRRKPK